MGDIRTLMLIGKISYGMWLLNIGLYDTYEIQTGAIIISVR